MAEEPRAAHQAALLLIDMINPLAFDGAERLIETAKEAADRIEALVAAARAAGVPVIYVNDNYGHWHSERSAIVAHVTDSDAPGASVARRLAPGDDDYFVIKPRFSGFYASNLAVVLPRIGATRLILTGVAADVCVLFTAADAHMREYDLWVPEDTVASETDERRQWALEIMRESMKAETAPTDRLALGAWLDRE